MQIILIGVLAFTAVAVMEALFYTLRFLTDRRKDELKRRLSSLGTSEGKGDITGLLRKGKLSSNATLDAILRSLKITARIENILEQTELDMTVARLLGYCAGGAFVGKFFQCGCQDSGAGLLWFAERDGFSGFGWMRHLIN